MLGLLLSSPAAKAEATPIASATGKIIERRRDCTGKSKTTRKPATQGVNSMKYDMVGSCFCCLAFSFSESYYGKSRQKFPRICKMPVPSGGLSALWKQDRSKRTGQNQVMPVTFLLCA